MHPEAQTPSRTGPWLARLDLLATIAVIVASASVVWAIFFRAPPHPPAASDRAAARKAATDVALAEPVSLARAVTRGSQEAKVAVIEYSDFQCPFCGRFARETLPALEQKYVRTGKVLIAFRHFPLPTHSLAQKAAEAVECAGIQGYFWQMHDRLFEKGFKIAENDVRGLGRVLPLDYRQFDECLTSGEMAEKVRTDADGAKALKVSGTPTFFVGMLSTNGRVRVIARLSGAQPLAAFEQVLDKLLD